MPPMKDQANIIYTQIQRHTLKTTGKLNIKITLYNDLSLENGYSQEENEKDHLYHSTGVRENTL